MRRLILNTTDRDIATEFVLHTKSRDDIQTETYRAEMPFFKAVNDRASDPPLAFVIDENTGYARRAISTVKSQHAYVPVVLLMREGKVRGADVYVPAEGDAGMVARAVMQSVYSYVKNFGNLQGMITKVSSPVYFDRYVYDPHTRELRDGDDVVRKLTVREGGVLAVLGANYGDVVGKSVILNLVWGDADRSKERTLDVYVAKLRKIMEEDGLPMRLRTVTGKGLLLESNRHKHKQGEKQ